MKISEVKDKYPNMIFTAQEFLNLKEIKELVKRIVDLEKEVENLRNQRN